MPVPGVCSALPARLQTRRCHAAGTVTRNRVWLITADPQERRAHDQRCPDEDTKRLCPRRRIMDSIIYLVGLIVVVMFILSVLGLR